MARKLNINTERTANGLTNFAKTVNPLLRQLLGENGMVLLELLNSWNEIVGTNIADYCLPQNISFNKNERTDGCLHLSVPAGAFAMEIQQNQRQIIEKINSFFGYPAVSKLKINQTGNPEILLKGKKNTDKMKKMVVTKEEESYITELIKDIESDELRQSLKKIGRAVFSRLNRQERKLG